MDMSIFSNPFVAKDCDGFTYIRKQSTKAVPYNSQQFEFFARRDIDEFNTRAQEKATGTIIFKTYQEAFLWINELLGQISDGKYENSPANWGWYFNLLIKVDPSVARSTLSPSTFPKSFKMSFVDLIWLFDEDSNYEHSPDEVRGIFSCCPTAELKGYLTSIAKAVNSEPL